METTIIADTAKHVAYALLHLAAGHPGRYGKLRAALAITGRLSPDDPLSAELAGTDCAIETDWPASVICDLADAMVDGGLLTETSGGRPTLCLTRAGFRALDAIETR